MNKISKRIMKLMEEFGFTEYRLTQEANITAGTLNRTLKADNAWKQAEQLYKIAKVFDSSMEYLITGKTTIRDKNQRVKERQQAYNKLKQESNRLKEDLEKALKHFVSGDKDVN